MRFPHIKRHSKTDSLISKSRRFLADLMPTSTKKDRDWLGREEETSLDWLGRKQETRPDWLGRKRR